MEYLLLTVQIVSVKWPLREVTWCSPGSTCSTRLLGWLLWVHVDVYIFIVFTVVHMCSDFANMGMAARQLCWEIVVQGMWVGVCVLIGACE